MALTAARSRCRVVLSCRLFSSVAKSRDREARDELPLFRYVGERRKPTDKVFVWGFSYSGALGIPSFVIPDSGKKRPRKYQLTPYRLDTEGKVPPASTCHVFHSHQFTVIVMKYINALRKCLYQP